MLPTVNQNLFNVLSDYVYGHTEAKKALIAMLTRSRLRYYQKHTTMMDEEFLVNPMKVLLMGASGTGKSFLVDSLRRIVYFPLVKLDATHLVPSGGSGGIKPNDVRKMIIEEAQEAMSNYPEEYLTIEGAVDRTIVFIDEVDKLGTSWESSGNWNRHVQSNFLTLFDNKDLYSGVSFIFAGAFTDLREKRQQVKSYGFVEQKVTNTNFIDEEMIKNGLIPELVGRLNYIVELDVFTEEDLYNILTENILPKKRRDLAAYGIMNGDVKEDVLKEIVSNSAKSGQGVRYLQRAVEKLFLDLEFDANVDKVIYNIF